MKICLFAFVLSLFICCSHGQIPKTRGPKPASPTANEDDATGKYVAFLVGIDNYPKPLQHLDYPVQNVTKLASILSNYNFNNQNILLLRDPNETSFFQQVEVLKKKVKRQDNLLVYIAAHGKLIDKRHYYWMSTNAEEDAYKTWIDVNYFLDEISQLNCQHILLIIDSCHGGAVFKINNNMSSPTVILPAYTEKEIVDYRINKSGEAITSGAPLQAVPDKSHFFEALIKVLEKNSNKYLLSSDLYWHVNLIVNEVQNNPNYHGVHITPQYSKVFKLEDEGGQFIFYKPNGIEGPSIDTHPVISPVISLTVGRGTKEFTIPAQKGQTIKVVASGIITVGQWVGDVTPNGTNTVQKIPFPTTVNRELYNIEPKFQHGSLLYRLSSDDPWELCGDHCSVVVPQSGRQTIQFIVNDKNHGDNSGKFDLKLSVQ